MASTIIYGRICLLMRRKRRLHRSFMLIVITGICISTGTPSAEDNALKGGTLRGQIVDYDTPQNPLKGVEVKAISETGKEFTTTSDLNGNYKFENLPPDSYTLRCYKGGYDKYERSYGRSIIIANGDDHVLQIRMHSPIDMDVEREILPLLEHITEDMGKRYHLDETAVADLRQALTDSIQIAIKHDRSLSTFHVTYGESNLDVLEA